MPQRNPAQSDMVPAVSLVDWISDTCPQGYTDLQSPVKSLVPAVRHGLSSIGLQGIATQLKMRHTE